MLSDCFDMYHGSNGASPQNSAGIADWKSKTEILNRNLKSKSARAPSLRHGRIVALRLQARFCVI